MALLRTCLILAVLLLGNSAAFAQGLPAPWVNHDIGAVGQVGWANHDNGTFTVNGSGTDIWGSSDQFHFGAR